MSKINLRKKRKSVEQGSILNEEKVKSIREKGTKMKYYLSYQELFDIDCMRRSKKIRAKRLHLSSFILRIYKSDVSTFTNFQDSDDVFSPEIRSVKMDWLCANKQITKFQIFMTENKILAVSMAKLSNKYLKTFKRLKFLTLYVAGQDVTNHLMRSLACSIRNNINLRLLALDVSNSRITDHGVIQFASKGFHKLRTLQKIDLGLGGNPLTNVSAEKLIDGSLSHLNDLQVFLFCLWHSLIGDHTIEKISRKLLKKWTNLLALQLSFGGTQITDLGIDQLVNEGLVHLKQLNSLEISLNHTNISENSIKLIAKQALSQMSEMRKLTLNLGWNHLSKDSLAHLGELAFQSMINLEDLKISFDGVDTSNQSFCKLSSRGLSKILQLKSLVLDMIDVPLIVDEGLNELALHSLGKMKKMELFRFCLKGNRLVTDNGLISLSRLGFSNLTNLKKLVLGLGGTGIQDRGITILASEALSRMVKMVEFELFIWGTRVGDPGINAITMYGLICMRRLERFKILVFGSKVTDESIVNMLDILNNISSFKRLTVDVELDEVVPDASRRYEFQIRQYLEE